MDDKEQEEILYRLDERTKRVDEYLDRHSMRIAALEETADDHEERLSDGENFRSNVWTGAKGFGAAVLAAISGAGAWIAGIFHI